MTTVITGFIILAAGLYCFALGMNAPLWPKKLKGSKLIACGGLILCFIASFMITPPEPPKTNTPAAAVAAELKKRVQLPKREGEHFSIIDVTSTDDTLVYIFRIDMEKEEAKPLADKMQAKVMLTACQAEEFLEMLKNGIGVEYRYQDKFGGPLGSAFVRPAMCNL